MEAAFLKFRLRLKMLIPNILGLWMVIFGLELQTQKLKAFGSGSQVKKALSYSNWLEEQPDNWKGQENCLEMSC